MNKKTQFTDESRLVHDHMREPSSLKSFQHPEPVIRSEVRMLSDRAK